MPPRMSKVVRSIIRSFRQIQRRSDGVQGGLTKPSRILLNQLGTLDKRRLERYVGRLNATQIAQVDEALKISLSLVPVRPSNRSN
jgi:mRNA-degrading endonuclease toxin of MazEF toxin-antitoxin module